MSDRARTPLVTGLLALILCASVAHAQKPTATKMLADFEDGALGIFSQTRGTVVPTKNLDGKAVLLRKGQNISVHRPRVNWTAFNMIKVDAFNPTDVPVRLHFCLKDDSSPHGYYSWINRYVSVKPGRSTIELYIPELRR